MISQSCLFQWTFHDRVPKSLAGDSAIPMRHRHAHAAYHTWDIIVVHDSFDEAKEASIPGDSLLGDSRADHDPGRITRINLVRLDRLSDTQQLAVWARFES